MLKIKAREISLIGLLIYLCGIYLGNEVKTISIIIFILLSIWNIKKIKGNKYAKYQFLFFLYLCVSLIWTHKNLINTSIASLEIITTFAIFYCSIFLFDFIKTENEMNIVIHIILISLVFMIFYLIFKTPVDIWGTFKLGQNIGLNKNDIGMNLAWGCIFCFYFIREKKSKKFIYIILFVLFFSFSLISGSRKALLIIGVGMAAYMILCERNINVIKNIIIAFLFVFIIYCLIMNIPILYELLGERTEKMLSSFFTSSSISIEEDKSIWERAFYRNYAINMSIENPLYTIFGHGLDAFRTRMAEIGYMHVAYSHCNYTEVLVNYGFFGIILYYFFKFKLIFKSFIMKNSIKI